jgi:hypothetical protein
MQKDEKRVQLGHMIYNRFFVITQNQHNSKTYEEFCQSSYYNAFVKFGSFINNVKPIYSEKFIDYVIKSGVKLDHWCQDSLYEKYLYDMLKNEPAEAAVSRTLETMIQWGDKHQAPFNHYFKYATTNRLVHDIRNGKVSPWIIFNCKSGRDSLGQLTDDQLEIISTVIDLMFWKGQFKRLPDDVGMVTAVGQEANIE